MSRPGILCFLVLCVTTVNARDGDIEQGRSIYQGTCIACHGADGKGQLPGTPDFTKSDGPLRKSDEELMRNIENGFQSPGSMMAMPPKGGNPSLDEAAMRAVIRYLRESFQPES